MSEWEVTKVVIERELGRPAERLREQTEKLQLHSVKAVMLEQQLAVAEERVRRLKEEKQAVQTRAEQAEKSVSMHSLVAFLFILTFISKFITQSFITFFCTDC